MSGHEQISGQEFPSSEKREPPDALPAVGELPAALEAMIAALSPAGLVQLERVVALSLRRPRAPARARRQALLGALARQIAAIRPGSKPSGKQLRDGYQAPLTRGEYELRRRRQQPSSERLVEHYGCWRAACRAAENLDGDRKSSRGRAWPGAGRGRERAPVSAEQIDEALQACATTLRRLPTSTDYLRWRDGLAEQQRRQRPSLPTIYRQRRRPCRQPRLAWRAIIAEAGVTVSAERGLEPEAGDSELVAELYLLPLEQAVALALERQVSLDRLAGRSSEPGRPPRAGARLQPLAIVERRAALGLAPTRLATAIGMERGEARRLLNGSLPVSLAEVARLAELLSCEIAQLVC